LSGFVDEKKVVCIDVEVGSHPSLKEEPIMMAKC
jgi:hypothetical protein